jgi:hypothetical protein
VEDYHLQDATYAALGGDLNTPDNTPAATNKNEIAAKTDASVVNTNTAFSEIKKDADAAKEKLQDDGPVASPYVDRPVTNTPVPQSPKSDVIVVNGLKAIYAFKGDNLLQYAVKYNIRYEHLLEMNDLPDAPLSSNMYVYLEKKNMSGTRDMHIVKPGETMLQVSQLEGIQMKRLLSLNKMNYGDEPEPGSVLELKHNAAKKPALIAHKDVTVRKGSAIKATTSDEEKAAAAMPVASPIDANAPFVNTPQPVAQVVTAPQSANNTNAVYTEDKPLAVKEVTQPVASPVSDNMPVASPVTSGVAAKPVVAATKQTEPPKQEINTAVAEKVVINEAQKEEVKVAPIATKEEKAIAEVNPAVAEKIAPVEKKTEEVPVIAVNEKAAVPVKQPDAVPEVKPGEITLPAEKTTQVEKKTEDVPVIAVNEKAAVPVKQPDAVPEVQPTEIALPAEKTAEVKKEETAVVAEVKQEPITAPVAEVKTEPIATPIAVEEKKIEIAQPIEQKKEVADEQANAAIKEKATEAAGTVAAAPQEPIAAPIAAETKIETPVTPVATSQPAGKHHKGARIETTTKAERQAELDANPTQAATNKVEEPVKEVAKTEEPKSVEQPAATIASETKPVEQAVTEQKTEIVAEAKKEEKPVEQTAVAVETPAVEKPVATIATAQPKVEEVAKTEEPKVVEQAPVATEKPVAETPVATQPENKTDAETAEAKEPEPTDDLDRLKRQLDKVVYKDTKKQAPAKPKPAPQPVAVTKEETVAPAPKQEPAAVAAAPAEQKESDVVASAAPKAEEKAEPVKEEAKPAKTDEAKKDDNYYTVKDGDTAFSIAKSHNITMRQLMNWNNMDFDEIKTGQKLKVKE